LEQGLDRVDDKILDANHGVKGGFAAAQRSRPFDAMVASKQEHPCDPGRTVDRLRSVEKVIITVMRY